MNITRRKITNFLLDEENHWVALLECGHTQHTRHNPPLETREWTKTKDGRDSMINTKLDCKKCSIKEDHLVVEPIGYIKTQMINKFDAPHQPDPNSEEISKIELVPNKNFDHGLKDIDGFSHIWLITWFDKNKTWKPLVRPPRGESIKRGVFATRSPHRPNPIGLTAVKLIKVEKNTIYIGSHDLIDSTPVFDIKPYIETVDSISNTSSGWVEKMEEKLKNKKKYEITFEELADKQINWLKKNNVNFIDRAKSLLETDPTPHKTRRIKQLDDSLRMSCGGWRIIFKIIHHQVVISNIFSGYPISSLTEDRSNDIPHYNAHIEFHKIWPNSL